MKRVHPGPSVATRLAVGVVLALGASTTQAYYTTEGVIYDHSGAPVQLRGVSWFGFETQDAHLHGIWARNLEDTIAQMQSIGINAVRLPFCPDTLKGIEPLSIDYSLNPDLKGLDSLEILDRVMARFNDAGMHILLDHHRPDCNAISELWYTETYSEQDWINDLVFVAERYKDLPFFMGLDLKNEPHGAATWGTGNTATDWNRAAERAARAVLAVKPNLLIFVEGIGTQTFCTEPSGNHFWGGNLEPLSCQPLDIQPGQLVLSPHVYGPDVFDQPYFQSGSFPGNLPTIWETHFGFATTLGYTLVVGEWGGRYGLGGDPRDRVWQDAFVDWMDSKNLRNSFYWSWNPNSGDTGGLLEDDWQTLVTPKVELLHRHWQWTADADTTPPPNDDSGSDSPPIAPSPGNDSSIGDSAVGERIAIPGTSLTLELTRQDDWPAGYCRQYTVFSNAEVVSNWQVRLNLRDQITNIWNATAQREGDSRIVITPQDHNASILPLGTATFGFCANRVAPAPGPQATRLSADIFINNDWGSGYCADVNVRNRGSNPVIWSTEFDVEGTISSHWNAVLSTSAGRVTASGVDWNRQINPGSSARFGFCAQR
ncbi:MAG: cellulase family glycosylhydrolase [Thioalkalivibrionaceae bacterium]